MTGAGDRAFCAGGDIVGLYKGGLGLPGGTKQILSEFPATEYLLDYSLTQLKTT